MYSEITAEPVAAASLGQVYRARLRATGEEVRCGGVRWGCLWVMSGECFVSRWGRWSMGGWALGFDSHHQRCSSPPTHTLPPPHTAHTHPPTQVAVKVQRPGIGDNIAVDMVLLRRLVALVDDNVPQVGAGALAEAGGALGGQIW